MKIFARINFRAPAAKLQNLGNNFPRENKYKKGIQFYQVYKRADKNGDGTITFNEFLLAYSEQPIIDGRNSGADGTFVRRNVTREPSKFTQDAIMRGCKYFWESDSDGDGRLNHAEFAHMLQSLGMNLDVRSVYRAFRIVDVDDNNLISFGEFATVYMNEIKPDSLTPDKIKWIFHNCDKSRKGYLTRKEFQAAMRELGNVVNEEKSRELFEHAAGESKGSLSLEAFCTFLGLESEEAGGGVVRNKRCQNKDPDNRVSYHE